MNREQRLKHLYDCCGLADDSLNDAEIKAYCAGLDYVNRIFDDVKQVIPQGKVMTPADINNFNSVFNDCQFFFIDDEMIITDYNINTIGKKCANWVGYNITVNLNAKGKSWAQINSENASWHTFKMRCLRWSMIRSL